MSETSSENCGRNTMLTTHCFSSMMHHTSKLHSSEQDSDFTLIATEIGMLSNVFSAR